MIFFGKTAVKRFCDGNAADTDPGRRNTFKQESLLRLTISDQIEIAQRRIPFIVECNISDISIQWNPAAGCLFISRNVLRADRKHGNDQIRLCFVKQFSDFSPKHRLQRSRPAFSGSLVNQIVQIGIAGHKQPESLIDGRRTIRKQIVH